MTEPRFSPDGGTSNQHTLNVFIQTATSGAQMRYTTNDPTPPSRTYGTLINGSSGWITLSLGHVALQAVAFKTGMADSVIHSAEFDYDNGQSSWSKKGEEHKAAGQKGMASTLFTKTADHRNCWWLACQTRNRR